LRKTKISFHAQLSQKILTVLRKLHRKNSAKLIAFHAQKFAKKICAKIAQILREKFSHFVETLLNFHQFAQLLTYFIANKQKCSIEIKFKISPFCP